MMYKKQETKDKRQKTKMKRRKTLNFSFLVILFSVFFISCTETPQGNPERFKKGVFYVPAGEGYSETLIKRIDSLQIEEYTKKVSISTDSGVFDKEIRRIDTLTIKWKNSFAYTLWMQNPRTELDKDPIFVQITKVTDTSYNFKARIGYSKFTTDGQVFIKK